MDNQEKIKVILRHCIQKECYGCPLRGSRDCVRSMAFTANQTLVSLEKRNKELEKQNAELKDQIAKLEDKLECHELQEESEDE